MSLPSPQPNLQTSRPEGGLSARFWLLVVVTGIGAGLGGGLLMKLLYAVQHFTWSYRTGTFLEAVQRGTASRHLLVLICAGVVAGVGRLIFRKVTGGHTGEISETIWFHSGKFPPISTLATAALSIVTVGMRSSWDEKAH